MHSMKHAGCHFWPYSHITVMGALVSCLIMGACTGNALENETDQTGAEIRLISTISPLTRGVNLDEQNTQLKEGQVVGVTIQGAVTLHNNRPWTAMENGRLQNGVDPIYHFGKHDITVYAYHPYQSGWANADNRYTFSIQTDQTADGYANSDLLYACASGYAQPPLVLEFSHRLAKINITLTSDVVNLANATISLVNLYPDVTFHSTTGELGTASGSPVTIKAGVTTTESFTSSAIVVPQRIEAGAQLVRIDVDGNTYIYRQATAVTWQSGFRYDYVLNVLRDRVELNADNVYDWEKNDQGTTDINE